MFRLSSFRMLTNGNVVPKLVKPPINDAVVAKTPINNGKRVVEAPPIHGGIGKTPPNGKLINEVRHINGGGGKQFKPAATFIRTAVNAIIQFSNNFRRRRRVTINKDDEIQVHFRMPVGLDDERRIKIFVDFNNILQVTGFKAEDEEEAAYFDCIQLPENGNFKNANYKATLVKGEVIVKVSGFKPKPFTIKLTDQRR